MHLERMKLMSTMLGEVIAGTWKPTTTQDLTRPNGEEQPVEVAFDLRVWLAKDGMPVGCGFSACAVGHACLDERFHIQGLQFDESDNPEFVHATLPVFGWGDLTEFFDLTGDQFDHLFIGSSYQTDCGPFRPVTAEMVKQRVDQLIENHEAV